VPPLDVLTTVAASVMTVASAAYMVTHATKALRSREAALAEALGQEGKLVLAERLVSLGRVAQGVAHELNTPLATIRTLASDMRAALKAAEGSSEGIDRLVRDVDESAALIHEETKRLGRITQSLLAGGDLLQARIDGNVPIGAVAARARMLVFAGADPKVQVEITPSLDRITAAADPDRLMQVLVNLLQNARDATKDVPSPTIRVDGLRAQDYVEISVEDNGSGLTADAAARLFEPFFTTKAKGTGLGLYTSYMMVRRMDGDLSLSPLASGGARATVRLPLSPEGAPAGVP
jgi:C4-dicarboxylate-specific signal transduction histidine kinase